MKLISQNDGAFARQMQGQANAVRRAVPAAVNKVTLDIQRRLRAQTQAAGLGRGTANAWRVRFYENGSNADVAGYIYTNAPKIILAFERGTPIRSKSGFWLAIPTDAAPRRGTDGKRISPSNFPESTLGRLRFVYRRGKPSLLVVDNVRVSARGRVRANVTTRRRDGATFSRLQGRASVVMFVLVPQVRPGKRLDVRGEVRRGRERLPKLLLDEMRKAAR